MCGRRLASTLDIYTDSSLTSIGLFTIPYNNLLDCTLGTHVIEHPLVRSDVECDIAEASGFVQRQRPRKHESRFYRNRPREFVLKMSQPPKLLKFRIIIANVSVLDLLHQGRMLIASFSSSRRVFFSKENPPNSGIQSKTCCAVYPPKHVTR